MSEQRQGNTALWTKRIETCDEQGKLIVMATPDWSDNSWAFDKACWEALPVVAEEKP